MAKDTERQSEKVAPHYSDPFGALRSEMEPCDQRESLWEQISCGSARPTIVTSFVDGSPGASSWE